MNTVLNAWPMTRMVKYLMIANGVVWLLTELLKHLGSIALYSEMAITPALVYPGFHLWQLFTYMWVHDLTSFSHILFNMLFLWMFGGQLEQRWGATAFIRFYLICGIGAGLVVFVMGSLFNPLVRTVGASGAIYGLVAAWAIAFPNQLIYLFGIFPMKGKYFALIPVGYALLEMIVGGSSTSHSAHLGGMLIGALLVTGFWRPRKLKNKIRYYYLRRKLRVIENDNQKRPPGGGYWN